MRSARSGLAWCLLGLCGACGFRVGYDPLSDCEPGATCTSDPSDVEGSDEDGAIPIQPSDGGTLPADGADGAITEPDGDAAQPEPPDAVGCGSLGLLRESFDGPDIGRDWFSLGNGEVALLEGQLELVLPAGGSDVEVTYNAHAAHDFRGSALAVSLVSLDADAAGIALRDGNGFDRFGEAITPDERGVALSVEGDTLRAIALAGTDESTLRATAYDPVQHRYLRLREAAGLLYWETSPDQTRWAAFHMAEAGDLGMSVFAMLYARREAGTEGSVVFDDVNVPAQELPGYCATDSLADDFDDDIIGPDFRPWNGAGSCSVSERDGATVITFEGDFAACALKANQQLDLRESSLAFELAAVAESESLVSLVELRTPSSVDGIELRVERGEVVMRLLEGDRASFEARALFDGTERFWRFRESLDRLYWDSSADGVTWTTRAETDTRIDASALFFALWGLDGGSGAPDELAFGSVNGT